MGKTNTGLTRRPPVWFYTLMLLGAILQGCAIYNELVQRGGSLPLGSGGAAWSPSVRAPVGGVPGVQIIQRF